MSTRLPFSDVIPHTTKTTPSTSPLSAPINQVPLLYVLHTSPSHKSFPPEKPHLSNPMFPSKPSLIPFPPNIPPPHLFFQDYKDALALSCLSDSASVSPASSPTLSSISAISEDTNTSTNSQQLTNYTTAMSQSQPELTSDPVPAPYVPPPPVQLLKGSIDPRNVENEPNVIKGHVHLPPAGCRKDQYTDLQSRIGMSKGPRSDTGKTFIYNITQFLLQHEEPIALWNSALLHKTNFWGPNEVSDWTFARPEQKYFLTIDVPEHPDPPKSNKSTAVTNPTNMLKRSRTDLPSDDLDMFSRHEEAENINIALSRSRTTEDRLAALELALHGRLHKDAEPNQQAALPNMTIEQRLHALELAETRRAVNTTSEDQFDQLIERVAKVLPSIPQFQKQADSSWSRSLTQKHFIQEIMFHLSQSVTDVAAAVATDALKTYVETDSFKADQQENLAIAAKKLDLSEIEQDRAKVVLHEYVKGKWQIYRENCNKQRQADLQKAVRDIQMFIQNNPTLSQYKQLPVPIAPVEEPVTPPRRPANTRYDSSDEEASPKSQKSHKDIESKIRKEVMEEQRLLKQEEETGRNLARRVATYLTNLTQVNHQPIGVRVKRTDANGKVTIYQQPEVKKYEKATEVWEEAQTQPPVIGPPTMPAPTYQQPAYQPSFQMQPVMASMQMPAPQPMMQPQAPIQQPMQQQQMQQQPSMQQPYQQGPYYPQYRQ